MTGRRMNEKEPEKYLRKKWDPFLDKYRIRNVKELRTLLRCHSSQMDYINAYKHIIGGVIQQNTT